jgi:hypothetical protein
MLCPTNVGRFVPAAEEAAIRRKPSPNGVGPGLRDLGVVLRIHARHADAADNLAADHDRGAAFHQIDPGHGEIPQSRALLRGSLKIEQGQSTKIRIGLAPIRMSKDDQRQLPPRHFIVL